MRALKPYAPDFSTAFEHFCIHPGGKAVISEVGVAPLSKDLTIRRPGIDTLAKRCSNRACLMTSCIASLPLGCTATRLLLP